jgi:hypothetical protein
MENVTYYNRPAHITEYTVPGIFRSFCEHFPQQSKTTKLLPTLRLSCFVVENAPPRPATPQRKHSDSPRIFRPISQPRRHASCALRRCATRSQVHATRTRANSRPRRSHPRTIRATSRKRGAKRRQRAPRTRHSRMDNSVAPTPSRAPTGFAQASPNSAGPSLPASVCRRRAPRASKTARSPARIQGTPQQCTVLNSQPVVGSPCGFGGTCDQNGNCQAGLLPETLVRSFFLSSSSER